MHASTLTRPGHAYPRLLAAASVGRPASNFHKSTNKARRLHCLVCRRTLLLYRAPGQALRPRTARFSCRLRLEPRAAWLRHLAHLRMICLLRQLQRQHLLRQHLQRQQLQRQQQERRPPWLRHLARMRLLCLRLQQRCMRQLQPLRCQHRQQRQQKERRAACQTT